MWRSGKITGTGDTKNRRLTEITGASDTKNRRLPEIPAVPAVVFKKSGGDYRFLPPQIARKRRWRVFRYRYENYATGKNGCVSASRYLFMRRRR
jgi:hypothetical protein